MTALEPNVKPEGRYSSRETAELLGISCETLRLWKIKGKIKYRLRRANVRPFYLGRDILACWKGEY